MTDAPAPPSPNLAVAAARGLCPRCGAPTLFAGFARFAPRCGNCGLDYSAYNVGDGPAALLTMVLGALIVGLALWVEFTFRPPIWVHVLLWVPLTAALVAGSLRVSKGALLILEHRNEAREGRVVPTDEPPR